MLSRRSDLGLAPNPLGEALMARRRLGRDFLDLTVSNPTRAGLAPAPDALEAALREGVRRSITYAPESLGEAGARALLAARLGDLGDLGTPVAPDDVVLTASTSDAYGLLFKVLCDPGDEVLVPRPSYPLLEHLAQLEAVRLVPYPLREAGGWFVDVAALRAAVTARTRAVVVVNPNNPTGSFVSRAELEAMADLGVPIVSDEVFGAYALRAPGAEVPATAAAIAHRVPVVVLQGLSKTALLPQLKLAWAVLRGPEPTRVALRERLEVAADAYLSAATPVQRALGPILQLGDDLRGRAMERLQRNLAAVRGAVAGTAVSVLPVEGGWYATLRLPAVRSEDDWVLGALKARDVLVQPGWLYDFDASPRVIVSLLTPPPTLDAGLDALLGHVGDVLGE